MIDVFTLWTITVVAVCAGGVLIKSYTLSRYGGIICADIGIVAALLIVAWLRHSGVEVPEDYTHIFVLLTIIVGAVMRLRSYGRGYR